MMDQETGSDPTIITPKTMTDYYNLDWTKAAKFLQKEHKQKPAKEVRKGDYIILKDKVVQVVEHSCSR